MFIRVSMMARLALLVGIWLVTSGNDRLLQFPVRTGRGPGPRSPGSDRAGPATFRSTLVLRNISNVETDDFVFGEPIRFDFTIENLTNRGNSRPVRRRADARLRRC